MAAAADSHRPLFLLSFRRSTDHQIHHSMSNDDLTSFHRHLADLFHDLSADADHHLLSIDWLRNLLHAFLLCQEEFRIILHNHSASLTPDFLDRSIKALDLLNAVRDGIDRLRHWRNHLDIILLALHRAPFGQGQLRRARKALADLSLSSPDHKDATSSPRQLRSRRSSGKGAHFRSLSCSVSRTWSAARQLQAMAAGLAVPRAQDVAASRGLANLFYAMSSVVVFVSWALVAAIPCQDRGLQVQFSVPRSFPWGVPIMLLHDRIAEESRKRDKKASGLLSEVQRTDKCGRRLVELLDENRELHLSEEAEMEVKREVAELTEVCGVLKDGLDPLECQVREVFHRMVRCRTEGLYSSPAQH